MTTGQAHGHADADIAMLRSCVTAFMASHADGDCLLVDGSAYSPSWRALRGGAFVWAVAEDPAEEAIEAYIERLDEACDELGLWWHDGCLWYTAHE